MLDGDRGLASRDRRGARAGFALLHSSGTVRAMKNIYVGNIPFDASEDDVRELFNQHGAVSRVKLITFPDTGRPRGFGFVEMERDADGDQAIEALNGAELKGRRLVVNEARTRDSGGGGRGRGRGRGGGRHG
jgi:RNA recognition motif-containing protein